MRKAIIKKGKNYKFGQSLKKGEIVLIEEHCIGNGRYRLTAHPLYNIVFGFAVTPSQIEYVEKEKFIVSVTRTSWSSKEITVEASNRAEAERLALDEAGNLEFSEKDAEYKTGSVYSKKQFDELFK